ncbi:MAG: SPOR domain-containing protein [Candidatus Binatia bacterium]
MGNFVYFLGIYLVFLTISFFGCSLVQQPSKKQSLIVTPPSSYTTEKARNLGQKYNQNLERLVTQVSLNPVTGRLQFANNIISVGGIGFFTHSFAKSPDERYLEVILGVPDSLDEKTDFTTKIERLISQFGSTLLSILSSDSEIYNDKEVAGYALNFSWRSASDAASGPRVTLESAVIYIPKDEARNFPSGRVNKEVLLRDSVIFAAQGERPAALVRYLPRVPGPEAPALAHKESGGTSEVPPVVKLTQPPTPSISPVEDPKREETEKLALKEKAPVIPKPEVRAPAPKEAPSAPQVGAPKREETEKLALKEKAPAISPERRLKPRVPQGYIIQVSFPERGDAERWSDLLKREGYSTSMSTIGESQLVRLRVGSFPSPEEARNLLGRLQKQGLTGSVLQVPK